MVLRARPAPEVFPRSEVRSSSDSNGGDYWEPVALSSVNPLSAFRAVRAARMSIALPQVTPPVGEPAGSTGASPPSPAGRC